MGLVRNLTRELRKAAFRAGGGRRYRQRYYSPEVAACLAGYREHSDISDHLGTLFSETVATRPRLVVELGTRGGESTRVLIAAASVSGASVLSVDIDEAPALEVPGRERWTFVRSDDVAFGREVAGFRAWCGERGLGPQADVIFIDTSHLYEHTREEIEVWHHHLAPAGALLFHDTNMGSGVFSRLDGTISASGWDNQRGVIRAVEEFLGRRYDERSFFTDVARGFLVTHRPNCNGFTVLRRIAPATA
jgi:cephalosporin hydroxylase